MANRKYVVREGFSFRTVNDKGDVKVYSEGDSVTLDTEIGGNSHQLQLIGDDKKPNSPAAAGTGSQDPSKNGGGDADK